MPGAVIDASGTAGDNGAPVDREAGLTSVSALCGHAQLPQRALVPVQAITSSPLTDVLTHASALKSLAPRSKESGGVRRFDVSPSRQ
jgi:hypothetical protein